MTVTIHGGKQTIDPKMSMVVDNPNEPEYAEDETSGRTQRSNRGGGGG